MMQSIVNKREILLAKIEAQLHQILDVETSAIELINAIKYSTLNNGKRIRPLLCFASGEISEAQEKNLLLVGSAIELIHCYSLIHDDLPAMDNDDLRRGIPTCHKKFNEALAILAGDALQALAFSTLSQSNLTINDKTKIRIISLIANMSGINGMVGGQAIDCSSTGIKLSHEHLKEMHSLKTGALIKASILAGYLCGANVNEEEFQTLNQLADQIGLLFQIKDDILDATSDTKTLGKTANKDLDANKATYVSILGIEKAQALSQSVYNEITNKLNVPKYQSLLSLTETIFIRKN